MNAYLWHGVARVSDNYHPQGSVLIEAATVERAREIAVIKPWYGDQAPTPMEGLDRAPDQIFVSPGNEEKVWVFPDAGCC